MKTLSIKAGFVIITNVGSTQVISICDISDETRQQLRSNKKDVFGKIEINDESGKWVKHGSFEIGNIDDSQYSDDRHHYVLTVTRSHG